MYMHFFAYIEIYMYRCFSLLTQFCCLLFVLHYILPIIQVGDPVSDFQTGEIDGGNKRGGGGGGRTLEPYPRDRIAGIVATASAQNSNRDVEVHRRSMILIQRFSQVFNEIC